MVLYLFFAMNRLLLCLFFFAVCLQSCAFRRIHRTKNIVYLAADSIRQKPEQRLNIFTPHNRHRKHPVLVYLYGGNWTSGRRNLYNFFGSRFARKGIVTVIPDYPKSPDADYREMAADAAKAVAWVKQHISAYGGDTAQIFIAGHSAGGHLAALISTDDHYFREQGMANPVKGTILIDAAGLDMYWYMKEVDYGPNDSYLRIFTKDPEAWKDASPLYHIHKDIPPLLMLSGGRSYQSIILSNEHFITALQKQNIRPVFIRQPKRKHIPMITQFFNSSNPRYRDILHFIQQHGGREGDE